MQPTFFATPADFRTWLQEHHQSERELLVGFYKKGSGRPSITWPESVVEALCFGWIDGVRRTIDGESYSIRFTPRKRGSIWSAVNMRLVEELIRDGRMQPAGRAAWEARDPAKSAVYSFERKEPAQLDADADARFRANAQAWSFWQSQPAGYRKTALHWVTSAKREDTRARRLETLIADSAAGLRIASLRRPGTE
jgi:uncharacterized protein YdeI (YjbR/CyaY-like superfamily)